MRLSERSAELVAAYLRRTRRFRTLGGVIGFVTWLLLGIVFDGLDATVMVVLTQEVGFLWPLVVGYLTGALAAELSLARARYSGDKRASLVPRDVDDYVDPFARTGLRAFAVLAVVLVPFAAILPVAPRFQPGPNVTRFALVAAAAVGIVLIVEWLQTVVVRRPQPFTAEDLVAADDAIRASSIHACAGVGLTLVMSLVAGELWIIGVSTGFWLLRWTLSLLSAVVAGGGLGIWLGYGTAYGWAVRRRAPVQP